MQVVPELQLCKNDVDLEEKEEFYNALQSILNKIRKRDLVLIIRDYNKNVGSNNTGREEVLGRHILKTTTEGSRTGIQSTLLSQLHDLDFADDLALLSHSRQHTQDKVQSVAATSRTEQQVST